MGAGSGGVREIQRRHWCRAVATRSRYEPRYDRRTTIDYGYAMANTDSVVVASPKLRRAYRSPQRAARVSATSQRVLRAATTLFAERGYAGTTIRSVAVAANVSVPTVETLFGTKTRLLKAAIDVAIAGDDEPVPMLDRDWATVAIETTDVEAFLSLVASVLTPAQGRSSGLVLSVFEGAGSEPELAELAVQMSAQRATMATWVVGRLVALGALRNELSEDEAVDTVFALMEPALFDRLGRHRRWTLARYERWVARSLRCLLVSDASVGRQSTTNPTRSAR
jgi:AcrR family transcriptional regulator